MKKEVFFHLVKLFGKDEAYKIRKAISRGDTIIISGPQGPTGKTTLAKILRAEGYPVIEKWMTYEVTLDNPIERPLIPHYDERILGSQAND